MAGSPAMAALGGALRRHWRSLKRFWSTSLAAEMEYQANLLVELLAVAGNLAGSLFTLSLFYGHGQQLGGWSWDQALVVLGLYTLLDGFAGTLLRPNLGNLVKQVQSGSLDFVLLKPIDSQFWLSLRSFSPGACLRWRRGWGWSCWGRSGPASGPIPPRWPRPC